MTIIIHKKYKVFKLQKYVTDTTLLMPTLLVL